MLAAAGELPGAKAVATIGAPFDVSHLTRLLAGGMQALAEHGEAEVDVGGRHVRSSDDAVREDQVISNVFGRFGRPSGRLDPDVLDRILERPRVRVGERARPVAAGRGAQAGGRRPPRWYEQSGAATLAHELVRVGDEPATDGRGDRRDGALRTRGGAHREPLPPIATRAAPRRFTGSAPPAAAPA